MNKVIKAIRHPRLILAFLLAHFGGWLSDERYLRWMFRLRLKKRLDLANPQTFNEKLQWLKLYDRNPRYIRMVDKAAVKAYIAETIGEQYLIPTLGVYDSVDEIDFDALPNQFVLKCTHDSGGVVICTDKSTFDREAALKKFRKLIKRRYYWQSREWPYKHIPQRIIAEQYMIDESGYELKDYKFFCFNGEAKVLKVDFDRFTEHRANYLDCEGNLLPFGEVVCPPDFNKRLTLPPRFDKMISIAERLSQKIPFVRVDLYNINGSIYFGEITFYPASGWGPFTPDSWDYRLGEWITLPSTKLYND